jgi:hypothetical protein
VTEVVEWDEGEKGWFLSKNLVDGNKCRWLRYWFVTVGREGKSEGKILVRQS